MTDKKDIVLAGQTYPVSTPLTLGQLIDLRVGVAGASTSADPREATRISYERGIEIVVAGLKIDHPEVDAKAMLTMRITDDELGSAVDTLLRIAGLVKDDGQGEAVAEAA